MNPAKAGHKREIKFFLLIAILGVLWYLGAKRAGIVNAHLEAIQSYLQSIPLLLAGVIFVGLYVVVTFFVWFSKDFFRFAGALIFGLYGSTILVLIAETINAAVLFYFSRWLGRDFVGYSLGGRYAGLRERIGKAGFFWLFLFRGTPLFPFRLLDLAAGLTTISLVRYMLAVIIGSPLRIFWQQYAYTVFKDAVFNPSLLIEQLNQNPEKALPLILSSFVYVVLIIIVAIRLKRRR